MLKCFTLDCRLVCLGLGRDKSRSHWYVNHCKCELRPYKAQCSTHDENAWQLTNLLYILVSSHHATHSLEPKKTNKAKATSYNTNIAPKAAYHSCSGTFLSQTVQAYSLQTEPAPRLWPVTKQRYAALVCRLMVSMSIIYVITGTFTDHKGMEGWVGLVGWPIADTLHMKWWHVNHRSCVDRGKFASQRLAANKSCIKSRLTYFWFLEHWTGTVTYKKKKTFKVLSHKYLFQINELFCNRVSWYFSLADGSIGFCVSIILKPNNQLELHWSA